jgi:glycerol-3-phosphate dehydrogenase (NAD(P)+)
MGGNEMSAYGLCHLGDYEATLFSKWSHNRMYGEKFVQGERFEKLAEGVMTTKAIYKTAKKKGIEMPIVNELYKVLFEKKEIMPALETLFNRNVKQEF